MRTTCMQELFAGQAWQPTDLERRALQKLREGLSTAMGGPLRAFASVSDVYKDAHSDAAKGDIHPDWPPGKDQAHSIPHKCSQEEVSKYPGTALSAFKECAAFSTWHAMCCNCAEDNLLHVRVQLKALLSPARKRSYIHPLQRVPLGVVGMLTTLAGSQTAETRLEARKMEKTPSQRWGFSFGLVALLSHAARIISQQFWLSGRRLV